VRSGEFAGPARFNRVLANVAFEPETDHIPAHPEGDAVRTWMG
jgi:hypothetical protein